MMEVQGLPSFADLAFRFKKNTMMTSLGLGPEALKALAAQCIGSSDFLSREFMHIEDFVAFFLKEGKPEINCV